MAAGTRDGASRTFCHSPGCLANSQTPLPIA
jgi:hypothetical protein